MITGAAGATINRLPVLLLPGDIFSRRNVAPVLQQLESPATQDISVNDCFRPISRYWDRISRPEQLITSLMDAMRVLTSPSDTGAVTLSLPQDVQTEAFDYPDDLFDTRVWLIRRPHPDAVSLSRAADAIRRSRRPIVIAGGGVLYSEASQALEYFVSQTGIPVAETYAGKGSTSCDLAENVGSAGATGSSAANPLMREADLVIGVGTRYSDFTTASMTAFQDPGVRFVNINVAEFDAYKVSAIPLIADARVALEELSEALAGFHVTADYAARISRLREAWTAEVSRLFQLNQQPKPAQSEIIGTLWKATAPRDVLVSAAGGHPGDLHKLWQTRTPNGCHLEYGYSCMGYEIPGAIGVKLAAPDREVYALVGDGTYLLNPGEIATAIQERVKITIVIVDNQGFGCIDNLSQAVGAGGLGTRFRRRSPASGQLDGEFLRTDLVASAASLGAHAVLARDLTAFQSALEDARRRDDTSVIVIETTSVGAPRYDSWWDVAVAEVSSRADAQRARAAYDVDRQKERYHLGGTARPEESGPADGLPRAGETHAGRRGAKSENET
jgi:3D-(3,5/4)-trihydroxycyclohexane-1,2-dione acylhydrolase (decyclizing)